MVRAPSTAALESLCNSDHPWHVKCQRQVSELGQQNCVFAVPLKPTSAGTHEAIVNTVVPSVHTSCRSTNEVAGRILPMMQVTAAGDGLG